MSNTDSFIDEVNEELRRERLMIYLRRYGWIAALAIILLVGAAAWVEYGKAQANARAEALGDAMLAALANNDSANRVTALEEIDATNPDARATVEFMTAAELVSAGDTDAAIEKLNVIAVNVDVPLIYRQIAQFKAVTLQGAETPVTERQQSLEALAQPGSALRLLAEEQLALIKIEQNDPEAAIARYQSILADAEVTSDLQQRALQVIVALGGEPDMPETGVAAQSDAATAGN